MTLNNKVRADSLATWVWVSLTPTIDVNKQGDTNPTVTAVVTLLRSYHL